MHDGTFVRIASVASVARGLHLTKDMAVLALLSILMMTLTGYLVGLRERECGAYGSECPGWDSVLCRFDSSKAFTAVLIVGKW